MTIEILNHKIIEGVRSASGIVKSKDGFYVVGDDSPFLYSLNKNFKTISKSKIHSIIDYIGTRIEKSKKPDFEALEMIDDDEIIAFGSGSKSPERDVFKRISLRDIASVKSNQISSFYDSLRNSRVLKNADLNIEAAAYRNGILYLFNRGNNVIFSLSYCEFLSYLEGETSLPKPKIDSYTLPKINGLEAGFSGATVLKNNPYIIFTASVEDTPNAYDDGEIYGSFIGMIPIEKDGLSSSFKSVLFPIIGEELKVESVTVKEEIEFGETTLVVVTDDDIKESLIIECRIRWGN